MDRISWIGGFLGGALAVLVPFGVGTAVFLWTTRRIRLRMKPTDVLIGFGVGLPITLAVTIASPVSSFASGATSMLTLAIAWAIVLLRSCRRTIRWRRLGTDDLLVPPATAAPVTREWRAGRVQALRPMLSGAYDARYGPGLAPGVHRHFLEGAAYRMLVDGHVFDESQRLQRIDFEYSHDRELGPARAVWGMAGEDYDEQMVRVRDGLAVYLNARCG